MDHNPLVNGIAYTWSQVKLNILNNNIVGVKGITYSEAQEMQDNFGTGNRPVSRGFGPITASGSITIHAEELEALSKAAPQGMIQRIPEFDVVVAYLPEGGQNVVHKLKNCRFKENKRELNQGDMEVAVELELIISHIEWTN